MGERAVTLQPGQVATLSVAMAAGTTIYNGDANNAIYVSGNPTPGPGAGMRVGPKGSLEWTAGGQPVYGTPESGVTSPVTLTVSDSVGSLVNPVDVGAAVAAQLLAKGVPSVLLSDTVFDGTFSQLSGGAFLFPQDFSKYASINIYLTVPANTGVTVSWFPPGTNTELSRRSYQITAPNGYQVLQLAQTVRGSRLSIGFSNPSISSFPITIIGTNRAQADAVTALTPLYKYNQTRAWTAGQIFALPLPFISNGGLTDVQLQWQNNGGGYMGYQYIDYAGNLQSVLQATTALGASDGAGNILYHGQYSFPPGVIQPILYATTAATSSVNLILGAGSFA